MPRVEVEPDSYVLKEGWEDDADGRLTRWVRHATATATGRSALLLALGRAAFAVHAADVAGHEFPSKEAATRWMKAREAYEAALAALREWDDHKGGNDGT